MDTPPERSWFGRNWKWLLPAGCLLPFVMVGGCISILVVGVFGALKASDAYTKSLEIVRADEQVKDVLGAPLEPSFLVSGNIHVSNQGGNADVHYDVTGPKGKGTVHAVAVKKRGEWTFKSLIVDSPNGEKINVLERQRSAELTSEPI